MKGGEREVKFNILVTNWVDIVVSATTPLDFPEGKTFDDVYPIPDFMKLTRVGNRLTAKGLKIVELYEVEDGRLDEALRAQFARELASQKLWKGYKSEVEILTVHTESDPYISTD